MPKISKEVADQAKARGAKVTKKLQQGVKPQEANDTGAIDKAAGALRKVAAVTRLQANSNNTMIQTLISALEERIAMDDRHAKPVRLKIHRDRQTKLIDYIDVVPIERITH